MAVTGVNSVRMAKEPGRHRRVAARRRVRRILTYLGVALAVSLFVIPFIWMIITSLKSPEDLTAHPLSWLPQGLYLRNYPDALSIIPYMQYLGNTMLICIPAVIGTLLSCSMAAYSLACVRWPGRGISFGLVLSTMMLPYPVTIIPLYLVFPPSRLDRHSRWLSAADGPSLLRCPFLYLPATPILRQHPGGAFGGGEGRRRPPSCGSSPRSSCRSLGQPWPPPHC